MSQDPSASPPVEVEAPEDETSVSRAYRAFARASKLQPGLQGFMRALTGNNKLVLRMGGYGSSFTNGRDVWITPPMELGDNHVHQRSLCGDYDETGLQLCEACRVLEELQSIAVHEIAHIVAGSFDPASAEDIKSVISLAASRLHEAHTRDTGDPYYFLTVEEWTKKITAAVEERKLRLTEGSNQPGSASPYDPMGSYVALSKFISPWLPSILNVLEDARVNEAIHQARPGTRRYFRAGTIKLIEEGLQIQSGEVLQYRDRPPNTQVGVAALLVASGYDKDLDLTEYFSDDVAELMAKPEVRRILLESARAPSSARTFYLGQEFLRAVQALGWMPDPEPEKLQKSDGDDQRADALQIEMDDKEEKPSGGNDQDENEESKGQGDSGQQDQNNNNKETSQDDSDSPGDPDGGESNATDGAPQEGDGNSSGSDDEDSDPTAGPDDRPAEGDGDGPGAPEEASGDDSAGADSDESGQTEQSDDGTSADSGGEPEESPTGEEASPGPSAGEGANPPEPELEDESSPSGASAGSDKPPTSDRSGMSTGDDTTSTGEPSDDGDGTSTGAEDGSEEDTSSSPTGGEVEGEGDDLQAEGSGHDATERGLTNEEIEQQAKMAHADVKVASGHADELEQLEGDWAEFDESDDRSKDHYQENPELPKQPKNLGEKQEHNRTSENYTKPDWDSGSEEMQQAGSQFEFFRSPSTTIGKVNILRIEKPSEVWDRRALKGMPKVYQYLEGKTNTLSLDQMHLVEFYTNFGPEVIEPEVRKSIALARLTFTENRAVKHTRNQKVGKLHTPTAGRKLKTGDVKVFGSRQVPDRRDYAVLIGADISGSTSGDEILRIKQAVYGQAMLLEALGIKFSVYFHTATTSTVEGAQLDLDLVEVKSFTDPWNSKARTRLKAIMSASANLDGHTMEVYRKLLMREQATHRVLLYYTDGAMPAANYDEEKEILIRELAAARKTPNFHILGVGIGTDSPKEYGLETVIVNGPEDLSIVIKALRDKLK